MASKTNKQTNRNGHKITASFPDSPLFNVPAQSTLLGKLYKCRGRGPEPFPYSIAPGGQIEPKENAVEAETRRFDSV